MAVTERERLTLITQPVVPKIEMWRALRSNVRAVEAAHNEARQQEIASRERIGELAAGLIDGSHRLREFIATNRDATVAAGLESQIRMLSDIADALESALMRVDIRSFTDGQPLR